MFIELEFDNLDTLLTQYDKTLVMYGAGWCGNCKLLKPKFKKVSTENEYPYLHRTTGLKASI